MSDFILAKPDVRFCRNVKRYRRVSFRYLWQVGTQHRTLQLSVDTNTTAANQHQTLQMSINKHDSCQLTPNATHVN